mmetsp:Transcript_28486/g.84270  ORF Transcript_28486/g.84270 Transcript_28486/m.84270 type:complete len:371 (+) Transcript_28486:588-1700(+)
MGGCRHRPCDAARAARPHGLAARHFRPRHRRPSCVWRLCRGVVLRAFRHGLAVWQGGRRLVQGRRGRPRAERVGGLPLRVQRLPLRLLRPDLAASHHPRAARPVAAAGGHGAGHGGAWGAAAHVRPLHLLRIPLLWRQRPPRHPRQLPAERRRHPLPRRPRRRGHHKHPAAHLRGAQGAHGDDRPGLRLALPPRPLQGRRHRPLLARHPPGRREPLRALPRHLDPQPARVCARAGAHRRLRRCRAAHRQPRPRAERRGRGRRGGDDVPPARPLLLCILPRGWMHGRPRRLARHARIGHGAPPAVARARLPLRGCSRTSLAWRCDICWRRRAVTTRSAPSRVIEHLHYGFNCASCCLVIGGLAAPPVLCCA